MYLVHTFSHLIMRELEFRCGYPTASLSERIFVSNDENYKMYGCLIYTAEGAEGSMGGLIIGLFIYGRTNNYDKYWCLYVCYFDDSNRSGSFIRSIIKWV